MGNYFARRRLRLRRQRRKELGIEYTPKQKLMGCLVWLGVYVVIILFFLSAAYLRFQIEQFPYPFFQ